MAPRGIPRILVPVGEAWRAARVLDPGLPLYAGDGIHPTELGSVAAAYVIWQRLAGRTPVGLPPVIEGGAVTRIKGSATLWRRAPAAASPGRGLSPAGSEDHV